jgi:hypothetical protein
VGAITCGYEYTHIGESHSVKQAATKSFGYVSVRGALGRVVEPLTIA